MKKTIFSLLMLLLLIASVNADVQFTLSGLQNDNKDSVTSIGNYTLYILDLNF